MFDHILAFTDAADARGWLSSVGYGTANSWDLSTTLPGIAVSRGGQSVSGFWVIVSSRTLDANLRDLPGERCKAVYRRDVASAGGYYLVYENSNYRVASGECVTPATVFAGSEYGALPSPSFPRLVRGVNLSGAEGGTVHGTFGSDYTYPTTASVDYFISKGANCFRIPFRWERVQHDQIGDLDVVGDGTGDWERLRTLADYIVSAGANVILDCHNYMRRLVSGTNELVGSTDVPSAALSDLWVKIAAVYSDNSKVWFNLMNEPNGITAADNFDIQQSVLNAIRRSGANNKVLISGTSYSGAHSWVSSGNADAMANLVDPAGNVAFDVHQYLDQYSGGLDGTCYSNSGNRLQKFIDWCLAVPGRKGFLGEFGAGPVSTQPQCGVELPTLLETAELSGAFIGWTAWGGGPWWASDYMFRLDQVSGQDTEFMKLLIPYLSS